MSEILSTHADTGLDPAKALDDAVYELGKQKRIIVDGIKQSVFILGNTMGHSYSDNIEIIMTTGDDYLSCFENSPLSSETLDDKRNTFVFSRWRLCRYRTHHRSHRSTRTTDQVVQARDGWELIFIRYKQKIFK